MEAAAKELAYNICNMSTAALTDPLLDFQIQLLSSSQRTPIRNLDVHCTFYFAVWTNSQARKSIWNSCKFVLNYRSPRRRSRGLPLLRIFSSDFLQ